MMEKIKKKKTFDKKEVEDIKEHLKLNKEQLALFDDNQIGIKKLMSKIDSENGKKAIEIADRISDMIIFHAKVRKNGEESSKSFDE